MSDSTPQKWRIDPGQCGGPHPEALILPDPKAGCSCTPHVQSAGGLYFERLLEYDPACPEHSEHVYNPRTGIWEGAGESGWEYGCDTGAGGEPYRHSSRRLAEDDSRGVSTITRSDGRVDEFPRRLVRRRKAGAWESVPDVS